MFSTNIHIKNDAISAMEKKQNKKTTTKQANKQMKYSTVHCKFHVSVRSRPKDLRNRTGNKGVIEN